MDLNHVDQLTCGLFSIIVLENFLEISNNLKKKLADKTCSLEIPKKKKKKKLDVS